MPKVPPVAVAYIEIESEHSILALGAGPATVKIGDYNVTLPTLLDAVKEVQSLYPEAPKIRFSIVTKIAEKPTTDGNASMDGLSIIEILRGAASKLR